VNRHDARPRGGRTEILCIIVPNWARRSAIGIATWLPFFVMWALVSMSYGHVSSISILIDTVISTGSAGLLGILVWLACRRWPWPHGFRLEFYLLQIGLATMYGVAWASAVESLEYLRGDPVLTSWSAFARQVALGVWFYAVFAGISHAVQTRNRLHDKEVVAARAEALAATARLDALHARLNPHFLFNALHTVAALVKFSPSRAEGAIQRLGDMLRYTLKEDSRGVVAFAEEYEFTQQYLAFEQLRYEDRLKVHFQIDSGSFDFDLPPFCIQTLAENAVHHAIATRPEGGSIWITSRCGSGQLHVRVRDDGSGQARESGESHQLGLRSVRERLVAAFGSAADLTVENSNGFQVTFSVPSSDDIAMPDGARP
jgi:signal transduction histidine kinase